MASLRDIRRRIGSVQNTRKITKAMEMVAAAKLRRNQARMEALRPYAADMIEMMTDLATYSEETRQYALLQERDGHTAAGVAITGDRRPARALRAGPPPLNDVIFLFTDGEERGLLGSQAFLEEDPWAYAAGAVLNFDSAGSSSPALMYETSPGNGELIGHYLAAGRPYGSSLMYEVSRRQVVVSDFRPFVARGIPGMTFGMLDGPAYDHTAYDSLAAFDEAGLQHEGETALALARRLGDADLWQLHAPDVVYFDLIGGAAVTYSGSWVPPFLVLALALFAVFAAVATRRGVARKRALPSQQTAPVVNGATVTVPGAPGAAAIAAAQPAGPPCPAFAAIPAAAARSAWGRMMFGDLPPSSRRIRFNVFAAWPMIARPTPSEPVNATMSTSGCSVSARPTSSPPTRTFTTPFGRSAASTASAMKNASSGVKGDGFSTTVLPMASAGPSLWRLRRTGKLNPVMAATTPTALRPAAQRATRSCSSA